ncbi:MAG: outer membrane protein OmpA-like peptidoglycan-associated protein [Akkermansiaceae bacterium]|jgi:outer membrane protein OmpA-like peptidoglycan-associated protein
MSEENEDPQAQSSTVTPASNQNLIIGIVMGAVVLLLLLLVISQQLNKDLEPAENKEIAALKKDLEDRKSRNEALRYASVPGVGQSPDALVTQIKSDTEALARLVNASASDAAMLQTAQENARLLSNRVTDLENQLRQTQADATRARSLESELNAARQAANGMVSKSQVDSLRDQLALAKNDRDGFQTEINQLRAKEGTMVDANAYALLKAEVDQLRKDNALPSDGIHQNENVLAKLFVTKDALSPRAVALYRELTRIEPEDHRARLQTYTRIDTQLKAGVGEAITFKTGSSDIALEHETHIKEMASAAAPNTFFLVVGYASPSGDSKTNEELSSQRTTRVASMVNHLKKEGQAVQAVYLGEGNRFGPDDASNQVCEIWQIRP